VPRAHTLRKERRLLPIKLSVDPPPFHWGIFSLTPSLCALRYSFVIYSLNLISMASTCCQPITHSSADASVVTFSKLLPPYDASMFGCATRFDLSAPPMNGHRFQAPPAVGQLLPSARTADLSEDGETLDSDDDGLPSVKQILASSKRAKRVIDLTGDYDDDGEGGDGDFTEVSWLRTTRTARYLVRLIPPFIDRIRVAGQLRSPYTALSDKVTGTYCRRSRNVVYGGHSWQEEKPLGEYPAVVPIAP